MQYALLIYEDETAYGPDDDSPALQEMLASTAPSAAARARTITGGAGLKGTATATTVRTAAGAQTIHDGPYAETKEQLGGFLPDRGAGPGRRHRGGQGAADLQERRGRDPAGAAWAG